MNLRQDFQTKFDTDHYDLPLEPLEYRFKAIGYIGALWPDLTKGEREALAEHWYDMYKQERA